MTTAYRFALRGEHGRYWCGGGNPHGASVDDSTGYLTRAEAQVEAEYLNSIGEWDWVAVDRPAA